MWGGGGWGRRMCTVELIKIEQVHIEPVYKLYGHVARCSEKRIKYRRVGVTLRSASSL